MPISLGENENYFNETLGSFKRNLFKSQDFPHFQLTTHAQRWHCCGDRGGTSVTPTLTLIFPSMMLKNYRNGQISVTCAEFTVMEKAMAMFSWT